MNPAPTMSTRDYLCALAVVLIWGTNFVVMKLGLQGVSPMLLGALRYALAAALFLPFLRKPAMPWKFIVIYGLVQGLGQFGLLFTAIAMGMTAGMASLLMQTQAFFTIVLAVPLLRESARAHQWLGLAIAAAGLAIIASAIGEGAGQITMAGFVLTLCAALMWASSNLIVRFAGRRAPGYDPLAFIVWSSAVPVLPFLMLAMVIDGVGNTWSALANLTLGAFLAALFLAVLATVLAYTLWTRLLMRHPAARIAPFSLLVPVIGLWAAQLVFDEHLQSAQWAGAAVVLAGLLVNQLGGWRRA